MLRFCYAFIVAFKNGRLRTEVQTRALLLGGLGGSWLSNLGARHLQSTSHLLLVNKSRTNALRKADVD